MRATQHGVSMEEEVRRLLTEQPWMTRRPRIPHTNGILMAQAGIGIDALERRTGLDPKEAASLRAAYEGHLERRQARVAAIRRDFPEVHQTLVRGAKAQFAVNSLLRGGCYASLAAMTFSSLNAEIIKVTDGS